MERQKYENIYKNNFIQRRELQPLAADEEKIKDSEEYKQVLHAAESFLTSGGEVDDSYHVSRNFDQYVLQNKHDGITNIWGEFASVFLILSWYSWRILNAPWRKSYFKVKKYSGHYQYVMHDNFSPKVAEGLMMRLGYIYHKPQEAFLFQPQSLTTSGCWKANLTRVGMDFFLVHARCSLSSTHTGRSMAVQDTFNRFPGLKFTSEPLGGRKSRKSDNYVTALPMSQSATMPRSNQPMERQRLNKSSRIESNPIPWEHRRKPKIVHQISEESDDIYEGIDITEVRYPPMDSMHDVSLLGRNMGSMSIKKQRPTMQLVSGGSHNNEIPRNYVQFIPRPPVEGKSNNEHIYQDINDDKNLYFK
nr:uncharacterized protein LOC100184132 [Ciona intestinalis]|eukprot:XP_002125392.1 uncharacterized protein LOC100184132 [Ciona intestinalis]